MDRDVEKRVERAMARVRKDHGADAIMRLGDGDLPEVSVLSTGSLKLNRATGIGGYPRGRIVEVMGPESAGKTTLALHAVAQQQRSGGAAAVVDAEHALDLGYARALGVDVGSLLLSQPGCGEEGLDIVETLVDEGVGLVVVDSVAALTPRAEIEGEMGDAHLGVHARLMSQAMRKLCAMTARTGAIVMFVNQLRHKIGVMFGSPETTTGGNALKFYASMRLDVRRKGFVKERGGKDEEDDKVGSAVEVKVVKNKLAPPFQVAELDVIWGHGIDVAGELLSVGVDVGAVEKSGNWFSFNEQKLGNGFRAARDVIAADEALAARISAQVEAAWRSTT